MHRTHRRTGFTLTEILIIGAVLALIVLISAPAYLRAQTAALARTCQSNLRAIDAAKMQFVKEAGKRPGDSITQFNLDSGGDGKGYLKIFPREPSGYMYVINAAGTLPQCTSGLPEHTLSTAN